MRIIQDSDDESEDDVEIIVPAPKENDASGKTKCNDSSNDTGSTESLKRAIQEAHRNHLQSQTSQNEPQSSVSLPEHPSNTTSLVQTQPLIALPGDGLPHLSNMAWNLDGTMREEYACHDPRAMFPEPSSTVPNATMTQRRILEGVAGPTMLGLDSEITQSRHMLPPEPSIAFSDFLKLSPVDHVELFLKSSNHEAADTGHASSGVQSNQDDSVPSSTSQLLPPILASDPEGDFSPVDANVGARPGDTTSPAFRAPEAVTMTVAPSTASPKEPSRLKMPKKRVAATALDNEEDELAAVGLPQEQYKPRPSRSRSLRVDEDASVDYSVRPEKAKKAPKRRKTTGNMPGTPELQSTPQKVQQICAMGFTPHSTERALNKNNGDVTSTIDWLITNGNDEDELAPDFKSNKPQQQQPPSIDPVALQDIMRGLSEYQKDENNAVAPTAEAIVLDDVPNESQIQEDIHAGETELPAAVSTSPKVQVIIPTKSQKRDASESNANSGKKGKRKRVASDNTEITQVPTEASPLPGKPEKKKGRGRPKKTVQTADTMEIPEAPEPQNTEAETQNPVQEPKLQEIEPNQLAGTEVQNDLNNVKERLQENIKPDTDFRESTPSTKPKVEVAHTSTPDKPTKTASRSPKSKEKVPYRVGLSKRARIAPLLRIMKK